MPVVRMAAMTFIPNEKQPTLQLNSQTRVTSLFMGRSGIDSSCPTSSIIIYGMLSVSKRSLNNDVGMVLDV